MPQGALPRTWAGGDLRRTSAVGAPSRLVCRWASSTPRKHLFSPRGLACGSARPMVTTESLVLSSRLTLRQSSCGGEDGATVNWRREPDTRLDVSAGPGRCSGGRRGGCVVLGLFSGAALGALAGPPFATGSRCNDEPCALVCFLTVPAGALVGTIVGAWVGGEHWKRATLPASVTVWPRSGRVALGLSVHF